MNREDFHRYMVEEMELSSNPDLVIVYTGVDPDESYCIQNEPGYPTPEDPVLFFRNGRASGEGHQMFYSWEELFENAVFRNGVKLKDATLRGEVFRDF